MAKKTHQKIHKKNTALSAQAFSFGEPVPVLDNGDLLNYFESVLMFQKYYAPPVDLSGLAKAHKSSSHHQSAISVKKNILLSTCETSKLLPRTELEKFVQDYLIFGNAYLEVFLNRLEN